AISSVCWSAAKAVTEKRKLRQAIAIRRMGSSSVKILGIFVDIGSHVFGGLAIAFPTYTRMAVIRFTFETVRGRFRLSQFASTPSFQRFGARVRDWHQRCTNALRTCLWEDRGMM